MESNKHVNEKQNPLMSALLCKVIEYGHLHLIRKNLLLLIQGKTRTECKTVLNMLQMTSSNHCLYIRL